MTKQKTHAYLDVTRAEGSGQMLGPGCAFRSAALIVNANSRAGCSAAATASVLLGRLGIPIKTTQVLDDPVRLPETVHEALAEGHDLIILGGGDGSVSSVVDFMVDSDAALGLLPLGTANDFARTLGIPFELDRACETVARGRLMDVDLGLAGDNYYANVASVGLSTAVTEALSPRLKRTIGAMAYPLAALRAYKEHQPFEATLVFPDSAQEPMVLDNLLQVAVGNGRFYGGGLVVAPDAALDDSALDVYAVEAGRLLDLARVASGLRSGRFVEDEGVHYWRTRRVQLITEPTLPVNIDGELVAHTPKLFSVAPNALKMIVPQGGKSTPQPHEATLAAPA